MNTLIIGANGQVGRILVEKMSKQQGVTPIAVIRKPEQKNFFDDLGVETRLIDLEDDIPAIEKAMDGIDAVVFTAGSGGSTGADKTMLIDLDGAVKSIEAARNQGIKRFVMVSSFDTSRAAIQEADSDFRPYVAAKHYADNVLRASDLDYTIVHPGILKSEAGSGKVTVKETLDVAEVARENIAEVLLNVLLNDNTIGKEFQVVNGHTDVAEAIKNI